MKSLLFILLGLYGSWHYTDFSSESNLNSVLAPIGVFIFMCSLLVWLVLKAGFGGKTSSGQGSDGFWGGGDSDGGGDGSC